MHANLQKWFKEGEKIDIHRRAMNCTTQTCSIGLMLPGHYSITDLFIIYTTVNIHKLLFETCRICICLDSWIEKELRQTPRIRLRAHSHWHCFGPRSTNPRSLPRIVPFVCSSVNENTRTLVWWKQGVLVHMQLDPGEIRLQREHKQTQTKERKWHGTPHSASV